jgi:hypothetical protein
MSTTNLIRRIASIPGLVLAVALVAGCAPKPETHTSFATPDEAVTALIAALEKNDVAALGLLLGPGSEEIVSSGDAVADKVGRESFVASYREKHELVAEGDSQRVLQVGEDEWPFPVPVVKRDGRWYLEGADGADEIIYRRVGRNELGAIATVRGVVAAQQDYAAVAHDGYPAGVYAQKLVSDSGMQDGLYWPTAEGETPSPAGPFVANAADEGYRRGVNGERLPYHGYYYRLLYGQGPAAGGGAMNYFRDGLLVDGFAMITWPADYGVSGVQTFIVNQDGVVFQKDLGDDTATAVEAIQDFDPDSSWTKVAEEAGG